MRIYFTEDKRALRHVEPNAVFVSVVVVSNICLLKVNICCSMSFRSVTKKEVQYDPNPAYGLRCRTGTPSSDGIVSPLF